MKIEDDLRKATDPREPEAEIARRNAERRLFGSTGTQSDRIRQEMQRYASMRDPVLRYVLPLLQKLDFTYDLNFVFI